MVALTAVLDRALRSLADAGRPQDANRLAARAWSTLRADEPDLAERLNRTMHYLARREAQRENRQETTMASTDQTLDVRSEIPRRRHELIFETYAKLGSGEGFVLVNDHDPKPLYYQFDAEHAGQFSWDYLEQGPETWRVRIGRV